MQRWVALKTIAQDKTARAEFVRRFHREAVAAGGLDHPNIVTIYETGEEGDVCFIAMQFLEGNDLESLLKSPDWDEEFSIFKKLDILIQVCRGLAYAHSKDVVHRDVKPANIMILPDGTAKLVDFGIARVGDTTSASQAIMGTAAYMAPEQLQGNVCDEGADVFAVGVVTYRMFTSRFPFEGDNVSSILYKILHGPPPPLTTYAPDCPPELEKIVLTALAKDRDQRYRTMEELEFEFQRLLASLNASKVSSHIEEARRLLLAGIPLKAKELLRRVLELEPTNAAATEMWQQIQKQAQEEHNRRKAQNLQEEGIRAFRRNDWVRALDCFTLGLQLDPSNETLLNYRDLTLREQEKIQAITAKMKAAREALRRGDQSAAHGYLVEALRLSPENAEAKSLLAQVEEELAHTRRRREAQQNVDRAQRALAGRAYDEALGLLDTAQALDAENRHVGRLRSQILAEQAASQKHRLLGEKIAAAKAALDRGDYKSAFDEAQNGLQAFPDDPALQQLLLSAQRGDEAAGREKDQTQPFVPASAPLDSAAELQGGSESVWARLSFSFDSWRTWVVGRLPQGWRPWHLWLGLVGVGAAVALVVLLVSRPSAKKIPPPFTPPGTVKLDVHPWARVAEVRNLRSQQPVNLTGLVTPVNFLLPAGDYMVVVENPAFGKMQVNLHVEPGGQSVIQKSFEAFDPSSVLKAYQ